MIQDTAMESYCGCNLLCKIRVPADGYPNGKMVKG